MKYEVYKKWDNIPDEIMKELKFNGEVEKVVFWTSTMVTTENDHYTICPINYHKNLDCFLGVEFKDKNISQPTLNTDLHITFKGNKDGRICHVGTIFGVISYVKRTK